MKLHPSNPTPGFEPRPAAGKEPVTIKEVLDLIAMLNDFRITSSDEFYHSREFNRKLNELRSRL